MGRCNLNHYTTFLFLTAFRGPKSVPRSGRQNPVVSTRPEHGTYESGCSALWHANIWWRRTHQVHHEARADRPRVGSALGNLHPVYTAYLNWNRSKYWLIKISVGSVFTQKWCNCHQLPDIINMHSKGNSKTTDVI